jgi:hypothetical protein
MENGDDKKENKKFEKREKILIEWMKNNNEIMKMIIK